VKGIVTIHQPNYLPWTGLFSKVAQTECFIIADTFQFEPIVKRNKIRTPGGPAYLTVPAGSHFTNVRIKDVPLPEDRRWQREHWRAIFHHYQKAPFFAEHRPFFEELYRREYRYLWQINLEIIRYLLKCFNIRVEVIRASELDLDPNLRHTDALIDMLKAVGARVYLSGPSGKGYLEYEKFPQSGIELKFFRFEHPVYEQRYPGFVPNLAAIDLLFNVGPGSRELVRNAGGIEDPADISVP